jgi:hypothetical protein
MSDKINCLMLPGGTCIYQDTNDARAQSEALRLGLLPGMMAQLRKRSGQRGVAGLSRDGDRIVAIIAWAGFDAARDNGWATFSISPANEETAGFLSTMAHRMVDADSVRMEGGPAWRN